MKMDPKKKFNLFKNSENFCSAPWQYFQIYTDGEVRVCAYSRTSLGNINKQPIEEILQSDKLKEIKKHMLENKEHPNCVICQKERKLDGFAFYRDHFNYMFVKNDIDYNDIDSVHVNGVDLHWSNTCHLKCLSCWAGQSSSIASEENNKSFKNSHSALDKVEAFILSKNDMFNEIYLCGGEPLMIKRNERFLNKIKDKKNTKLRVNSNLQINLEENKIFKEISNFDNVEWTISIDGIKDEYELLRVGSSWTVLLDNINFLKKYKNFSLKINTVFSLLTANHFVKHLNYFINDLDIKKITINQADSYSGHLLVRNLPKEVKNKVCNDIEQFLNDNDVDSNLKFSLQLCIENCKIKNNLSTEEIHTYFKNLGKRRNIDWERIFKYE